MSRENAPLVTEIQQLIADEEDKRTRALLMILQQLSLSHFDSNGVVANLVNEVKQQRTEFEAHCQNELQLLSQAKGGQIVAKFMFSAFGILLMIIQAIGVYEFNEFKDSLKQTTELSKQNASDIRILQNEALK